MKFAAAALLSFVLLATPASAADVTVREFSATELESLDAYRDHVAWTESSGRGQNQLMTLVNGTAVAIPVKPVEGMDVAAGPDGQPVVVYNRCGKQRCTFYTYDFATGREQVLKGAPAGNWENWSFWRDRFVLIRKGRLVVFPLGGKPRDVGRAKTLADKAIDFNGVAVSYVNQTEPDADVEQYSLAYWPVTGKGRSPLNLRHGLSGDLSMAGAYVSSTYAYATQRSGEFGGPNRLWRIKLSTGKRDYAGLPSFAAWAVPLGAKQAVVYGCPTNEDDDVDTPCRLVLRDVTYR